MKFRTLMASLAIVGLIAGACQQTSTGGADPDRSKIDIEVVTHGQASDPFWSVVKNGVDAGRQGHGRHGQLQRAGHLRHGEDGAS